MKVRELIQLLAQEDPESEVILQKDGEGNGYSPLAEIDGQAIYVPETTWSGEVYPSGWSADEVGMTETEWDEVKRLPRCVVLCPVN